MNDIYCTYFDHNYLSRASVMIESLRRFDPQTPIYVLALSDLCAEILRELSLPKVEIIPLAELEGAYEELTRVKPQRNQVEYYYTLSPFLPSYLFAQTGAERITYIDGDLYFYTSPRPLLDSLAGVSVAITPHRFSFEYRNHLQYGRFNVGWITYTRCAEALDCLNAYRADCAEWCFERLEDNRYGDQKYLDAWPDRYPSLKVIEHKGFNLSFWNVNSYMLRMKDGHPMIDNDPLVFYHFSSIKLLPDGDVLVPARPRPGRSTAVLLDQIIAPYTTSLKGKIRLLHGRFPALAQAETDIRQSPAPTG
jgi:hypothetical protein